MIRLNLVIRFFIDVAKEKIRFIILIIQGELNKSWPSVMFPRRARHFDIIAYLY